MNKNEEALQALFLGIGIVVGIFMAEIKYQNTNYTLEDVVELVSVLEDDFLLVRDFEGVPISPLICDSNQAGQCIPLDELMEELTMEEE